MAQVFAERVEELRPKLRLWRIAPGMGASSRAIATLKSILPLGRDSFERRLVLALRLAADDPNGFFLEGYAARRALGPSLVINIDPMRLKQRMKHRAGAAANRVYFEDKFIGSGHWQPMLHPISGSSTHRDVQEVIGAGLDYRNTEAYRRALAKAGGTNPVRRNFVALKSPQLVDRYFRQVVDLCQSITKNGISRRADFRHTSTAFKNPAVRLPWVELVEADIGMAIGPSGELYHFGSGKHRIAAAQAMRLSVVPAEVRLVHFAWLQHQMVTTRLPPTEALLHGIRSLDLSQH